jgi:drug/metabolite transporter (DMT)-like permease
MSGVARPGGRAWDRPTKAVVAMLSAVGLFCLMDAGLKQLSGHYPAMQVAALRGAASLPLALAWALTTTGWRGLLRVRWPLHLLRGVLGVMMIATFVHGVRTLPLSTAYSIFFVAPLLITALSGPILGERVGPRRWIAIAIGMVGVLIVLRPTGEGMMTTAGVAVFLSALGYAAAAITVRVLSSTDTTQAMVVWLMASMAAGAGALAAPGWVHVRGDDAWLIGGVGLAGALGQYAITEAFRVGEASLLAPLEYSALLWGAVLDLTFWHVLPDGKTWMGAAVIVASGLYLLRREPVLAEAAHPRAEVLP